MTARERLFGYEHAFDHPIAKWITISVVGVLAIAALLIWVLALAGLIGAAQRDELRKRTISWIIMAPLMIGPILLGAFWTILAVCALSLACYREYARATGLFREKTISFVVVLGILSVTFAVLDHWKLNPARDLGLPLKERARSVRRETGLIETFLHSAWWLAVRGYLGIYHRLEISGRENLSASLPFVIVANHSSHLDALVLAAALPVRIRERVFPIAAGDTFFETPATAAFAAFVLNALPIW